ERLTSSTQYSRAASLVTAGLLLPAFSQMSSSWAFALSGPGCARILCLQNATACLVRSARFPLNRPLKLVLGEVAWPGAVVVVAGGGGAVVVVWVVVWTPAGLVAPVAVACGTLVAAVEPVADLELLPQPARSAAPASAVASQVDDVALIGHD